MIRSAFKAKLKPGCEDEYKRRHDNIWPELKKVLSDAGIYDYSIFLDTHNGTLFGVQKLTDDNTVDQLPNNPIMRKWWDYMADIMECNPDNTPVIIPLKEVFHLD